MSNPVARHTIAYRVSSNGDTSPTDDTRPFIYDDDVDMGPFEMTLVECRESPKGIAKFIAQDA